MGVVHSFVLVVSERWGESSSICQWNSGFVGRASRCSAFKACITGLMVIQWGKWILVACFDRDSTDSLGGKPCVAAKSFEGLYGAIFECGMINSSVPLAISRLRQVPRSMIHGVMSEVVWWQYEIQEISDQWVMDCWELVGLCDIIRYVSVWTLTTSNVVQDFGISKVWKDADVLALLLRWLHTYLRLGVANGSSFAMA